MDYTMDVVMHDAMNDSMHPCRALCGSARAWLARRFESRCLALASRSASIRAAASSESRRIAPFISGSDERGAGALRMPRRGGPVTLDGFCPRLRAASACSADAVQMQCRCSAGAVQMQCRRSVCLRCASTCWTALSSVSGVSCAAPDRRFWSRWIACSSGSPPW